MARAQSSCEDGDLIEEGVLIECKDQILLQEVINIIEGKGQFSLDNIETIKANIRQVTNINCPFFIDLGNNKDGFPSQYIRSMNQGITLVSWLAIKLLSTSGESKKALEYILRLLIGEMRAEVAHLDKSRLESSGFYIDIIEEDAIRSRLQAPSHSPYSFVISPFTSSALSEQPIVSPRLSLQEPSSPEFKGEWTWRIEGDSKGRSHG